MSVPGGWEGGSDALRAGARFMRISSFSGAFLPSAPARGRRAGVGDAPQRRHRTGPELSSPVFNTRTETVWNKTEPLFTRKRVRNGPAHASPEAAAALLPRCGDRRDPRGQGGTATARLRSQKHPQENRGKDSAPRHHCSLCLAFQGAGLGFAAVQRVLCGILDISSASRTPGLCHCHSPSVAAGPAGPRGARWGEGMYFNLYLHRTRPAQAGAHQ